MKKVIMRFSVLLFSAFSLFLLFRGSFFWEGGSGIYEKSHVLLRGLELTALAVFLFFLFTALLRLYNRLGAKEKKRMLLLGSFFAVVGQILVVTAFRIELYYDALKVVDEAIGLFRQGKIGIADLDGYFARYANNHAAVILTYWILRLFRLTGIVGADFSGAVLALQYVNIFFSDLAFLGVYRILRRWRNDSEAGAFVFYMILNPLTYVWMPFYYTNTLSMPFAVWGCYFFLAAVTGVHSRDVAVTDAGVWKRKKQVQEALFSVLSAALFAVGIRLRATVGIMMIACVIVVICMKGKKKPFRKWCVMAGAFALSFVLVTQTSVLITKQYMAFDDTDTKFPVTHWVAMGLSHLGIFSTHDEFQTMEMQTAQEKRAYTCMKIRKRVSEMGPDGVAALYMKKLSDTFADGTAVYYDGLSVGRNDGMLWQCIYGDYRDPLLWLTQASYLLSVAGGLFLCLRLWQASATKKEDGDSGLQNKDAVLFAFLLVLLGSWLFQMIWEAGTIYSIGLMYANGLTAAVFLSGACDAVWKKSTVSFGLAALAVSGTLLSVVAFCRGEYEKSTIRVYQYMFPYMYDTDAYMPLSQGETLCQTFVTDKRFSEIAIMAYNPAGEESDVTFRVSLSDENGEVCQNRIVSGREMANFQFYEMDFSSDAFPEGTKCYRITITMEEGKTPFSWMYYGTGNYDTYPGGELTGPMAEPGGRADLVFRVS